MTSIAQQYKYVPGTGSLMHNSATMGLLFSLFLSVIDTWYVNVPGEIRGEPRGSVGCYGGVCAILDRCRSYAPVR